MKLLISRIFEDMWLWGAWVVIPIVFEIIPSIWQTVTLMFKKPKTQSIPLAKQPYISIVIPVYNSEKKLYACLESIAKSSYDLHKIQIIIVDNQSVDQSFQEYQRAQQSFPNLRMQWMSAQKGKARAINSALYGSTGSYVIHVDSDGIFHPKAIENMISMFEANEDVDALTGVILTQKDVIKKTKSISLKILQLNEYYEYAQAFFAGRNIESSKNQLFTMSGAFSAFRRSVLMNTYMYNLETVGEDTDITFQIRTRLKGRVALCNDALFFVEPIENLNQLYLQRQRWQRGEIEVSHLYMDQVKVNDVFNNFMIRRLLVDHTFAFPRFIWLFAVFALMYYDYSWRIVFGSLLVMYLLYCLNSFINYLAVKRLLKPFPQERKFYRRNVWVVLTLPFYNLLCFFIRFIGIINAMLQPASWSGSSYPEEMQSIKNQIKQDFSIRKKKSEDTNHD